MPIKSVKMKISKNKKMRFFLMSEGSLNPNCFLQHIIKDRPKRREALGYWYSLPLNRKVLLYTHEVRPFHGIYSSLNFHSLFIDKGSYCLVFDFNYIDRFMQMKENIHQLLPCWLLLVFIVKIKILPQD